VLQKTGPGKRFIDWVLRLGTKRKGFIEKYKLVGLTLFVAIPLPVTGAWTASLVSYILGLNFWHAFIAITIGVLCAGVVITILTLLGWIGAGIAIIALIILGVVAIVKS
jgi:uncharacterized membrane protein